MSDAELYLVVEIANNDDNWYRATADALSDLVGIENVQIVKAAESSQAQITFGYSTKSLTLDQIESALSNHASRISEIVISLNPTISGAADVYTASAFALPVRDQIGNIPGVKGAGISERGWIKIELDGNLKNKQAVFSKVLVEVFKINLANPSVSDL